MSIEVMRQALEELEADDSKLWPREKRTNAITTLRAAIEAAEKQEPVAKWDETRGVADRLGLAKIADETLLYTTPQPAIPAGWQPIETAPKDGSVLLLGLPAVGALKDSDQRRVYEGRWNETQKTFTSVNGFIVLSIATHWMPLPAAPKPENSHG